MVFVDAPMALLEDRATNHTAKQLGNVPTEKHLNDSCQVFFFTAEVRQRTGAEANDIIDFKFKGLIFTVRKTQS